MQVCGGTPKIKPMNPFVAPAPRRGDLVRDNLTGDLQLILRRPPVAPEHAAAIARPSHPLILRAALLGHAHARTRRVASSLRDQCVGRGLAVGRVYARKEAHRAQHTTPAPGTRCVASPPGVYNFISRKRQHD